MTKKLLLSSPIRPFGPKYGDALSCQTNSAFTLTSGQDVFRIDDQMQHWSLDLIASNISAPTTVLHFPSLGQFIREIKKNYDYIGISFTTPTFHKLKKMICAIRKYAPRSKIILGGLGTAIPEEELNALADYICRGEGISFIRELLKEDDRPFVSPDLTVKRSVFSLPGCNIGVLISALGCSNGCDFCSTSHFFKRKKIYFHKNGFEVFEALMRLRNKNRPPERIFIFDEDFLSDKKRAGEFLESARACPEQFDIMIFASIRSLSEFSASDIAQMGITKIWVGFEAPRSGYEKLKGKPFKELVSEFSNYGISIIASMIIGLDYQTKEIIAQEFDKFISSNPAASQFGILIPCVGTPLRENLNRQGRLTDALRENYGLYDGTYLLFRHPNLSAQQMEHLQRELYLAEYSLLGPSLLRMLYNDYTGYKNLKDSQNLQLRKRTQMFLRNLKHAHIAYRIGIRFAPNQNIRKKLTEQYCQIIKDIGNPPITEKIKEYLLIPFVFLTAIRFRHNIFMQPKYEKKLYNQA